jgi:hypothetical protein
LLVVGERVDVRKVVGMLEVWLVIEDSGEVAVVVDWAIDVEMSIDRRRIDFKTFLPLRLDLELSSMSLSLTVRAEFEGL